jgi:hypothetical protein
MHRMAWTNERLEERFDGINRRFDEVDRRFDEVGQRFTRVEGEIVELRSEMRAGFATLQSVLNWAGGGIIVTLFGVIAAILVKGG